MIERSTRIPGLLFTGLTIMLSVTFSNAAIITVTNNGDNGPGSLRQAILDAVPDDEIRFDPALDGLPIVLTTGELMINKDLIVTGRGRDNTILDGNGTSRVFWIELATVSASGITVRNGRGSYGAGIHATDEARLALRDCTICDNYRGGGIYITDGAYVALHNCTISRNLAYSPGAGGVHIAGSDLWGRGSVYLSHSTVSDNVGPGIGGYGGAFYVSHSTVSGNVQSGIKAYRGGTVRSSTISGNTGGYANAGGIYVNGSSVSVFESTITANSGGVMGGGGIGIRSRGRVRLRNSIVAGQISGSDCRFPSDVRIQSLGGNLIGDWSCRLYGPGDIRADPRLLPLADNGGPTWTHAIPFDSPANDAGGFECESTDQRGVARPQDGDWNGVAPCDIGAFERRWDEDWASLDSLPPAPTPVPDPELLTVALCHDPGTEHLVDVDSGGCFTTYYYQGGEQLQLPRAEARQHLHHGDVLGSCESWVVGVYDCEWPHGD